MCGRYELHTHPAALALALGLEYPPEIQARYNIAPTQPGPIVRLNKVGERELSQVRWGPLLGEGPCHRQQDDQCEG